MPSGHLRQWCLRCRLELDDHGSCRDHGVLPAVRRPAASSYEAFAEHLVGAGDFPTYLPWPMHPGWSVSDFARVDGGEGEGTLATLSACSGTSQLDGPVDAIIVAEEAGVGLGARCAGLDASGPHPESHVGPPAVRVRIGNQSVPLWAVSTSETDGEWDRAAFVGEAHGRWLWMVMVPASAMLLLRDEWILRDVSGLGPPLVEMPFVGPGPPW